MGIHSLLCLGKQRGGFPLSAFFFKAENTVLASGGLRPQKPEDLLLFRFNQRSDHGVT
jgi:hypothetical protein